MKRSHALWYTLLVVTSLAGWAAYARAEGPVFLPTGPDAAAFGAEQGYPVGSPDTWREPTHRVGSHSRFDTLFPTNRVTRAASPWNFQRATAEPDIRYEFGGRTRSLDEYLAHFPVTGLLLLQGDTLLLERYQYGREDTHRFASQSMAKSIMALLAGVALGEGRIRSLDDPVSAHVPALQGTLYGGTPLRLLLQMSSGIAFDEKDPARPPNADTQRLWDGQFSPGANPVAVLADCRVRAAAPGTRFHYSSGDSEAAGIVLRHATGATLSAYLSEKIWQPIGAEADATWAADTSGQEYPFYGFNAVLRDYARLGRLLAHDGNWNGRQIVPRQFLIDATTIRPEDRHLLPGAATPYYGYGYQIWIFPGDRRMFVLRGAYSQYVFVDPASKLVLVQTAVRSEGPDSENGKSECMALWLGIVRQLGGG